MKEILSLALTFIAVLPVVIAFYSYVYAIKLDDSDPNRESLVWKAQIKLIVSIMVGAVVVNNIFWYTYMSTTHRLGNVVKEYSYRNLQETNICRRVKQQKISRKLSMPCAVKNDYMAAKK